MATRTADVDYAPNGHGNAVLVSWAGLLQSSSDVGSAFEAADYADRSIQVQGTIGAAGNCRIEGSNDGTNYVTLTDPQGNALDIVAAGRIEQVQELTRYIRPRITAGDGTTDLTVTLYGARK